MSLSVSSLDRLLLLPFPALLYIEYREARDLLFSRWVSGTVSFPSFSRKGFSDLELVVLRVILLKGLCVVFQVGIPK